MDPELFISETRKLALFHGALVKTQLQEIKDHAVAHIQTCQMLHQHHQQEMTQISMLYNPIGWALAIRHYTRQLTQVVSVNRHTRNAMIDRHVRELTKLDSLIKRQTLFIADTQQTDILFLDRFIGLFDWSFSEQQQHYYHQALRSGYALVLTDMNQSIVWVNQAFETMTGYTSGEVTGRNARFLQGEATDQATRQRLQEQLGQAREVEVELINYRKRGDAYLCHLSIKLLINQAGEPTHFMAIEREVNTPD